MFILLPLSQHLSETQRFGKLTAYFFKWPTTNLKTSWQPKSKFTFVWD